MCINFVYDWTQPIYIHISSIINMALHMYINFVHDWTQIRLKNSRRTRAHWITTQHGNEGCSYRGSLITNQRPLWRRVHGKYIEENIKANWNSFTLAKALNLAENTVGRINVFDGANQKSLFISIFFIHSFIMLFKTSHNYFCIVKVCECHWLLYFKTLRQCGVVRAGRIFFVSLTTGPYSQWCPFSSWRCV